MIAVDRLGFHVRLKTQDGMRGARIAFLREVSNPAETRKVLVRDGATGALAGRVNSLTIIGYRRNDVLRGDLNRACSNTQ